MTHDDLQSDRSGKGERLAVAAALVYPTLLTWVYFTCLDGQAPWLQQAAYGIGKTLQFVLPVVWVWRVRGERLVAALPSRANPSRAPSWRAGLGIGLAFGVAVAAAMLGLYHGGLSSLETFDRARELVQAKVGGFQLDSPARFIGLSVFYSLAHSGLEEYYWRWFVFRRLRRLTSLPVAIGVSSVGFMTHHLIPLSTFFGWSSGLMWLAAAGIVVGGAFWAWLYDRSKQIWGPWVGHLLVDAAIFAIGYHLIAR